MGFLLLDQLIRPVEDRLGDREAEGVDGLEIDNQVKLGRLLLGEIAGFSS